MVFHQSFEDHYRDPYGNYSYAYNPYVYPESYNIDINDRRSPAPHICYKTMHVAGTTIKVPTTCNPGSPPGKKGYERKLGEINWKEPYTYECWYKVGPIKTKGVCSGMADKGVEYFYGLTYPDNVNPLEEQTILNCAYTAGSAGWSVLSGASTNPVTILAAIPAANATTQETMKKCMQATPLAPEVKNNITIGITHRRK